MDSSPSEATNKTPLKFHLCRQRRRVWLISSALVLLSALGIISSWLNPSIGSPLRPGLDFTGGTQISLERTCDSDCSSLNSLSISKALSNLSLPDEKDALAPDLSQVRVQLLDGSKTLVLRLPFLSASQGQVVIDAVEPFTGPLESGGLAVDTIGPSLGGQLLRSSLISLIVALTGIAIYITIRYDRFYALLTLVALAHDLIIICGIFAWLGLFISLEVDSLFAVALLTIAGYSVNDTVVVFDRIRELGIQRPSTPFAEQIDRAVSATFTRTVYTSSTTLLPLIALIFFGGVTLYWFAIALALGVVVGSWSSIALAPTLLSLGSDSIVIQVKNNQSIVSE